MELFSDIAIIGGGPAGICAAIAGSELGLKTVLIQDRPVLGGNSSSEIRVWTRGATGGGNLFAEEMGIWGRIKLRNLLLNPECNPVIWDDVLLEQVIRESNIILLLNTHITDITQKNNQKNRVDEIIGFQMGTEQRIRVKSRYFIDATGDGTIGAMLGVPYIIGREETNTYNEQMAPKIADKNTFGNTVFFFTKNESKKVIYKAPEFVYNIDYIKKIIGNGGRVVNEKLNGCDYWWFEIGGLEDTITDNQNIAFELKKLVLGVWNYIKNSGKFDADNLALEWIGNLPGKRESRRMITDYVLTENDVIGKDTIDDGLLYGGWYMDFHPSEGLNTTEDFCTQLPVQVYPISQRCLYNSKFPNLLFAGRNIGTSHIAFASTRIMNTCALTGEAAAEVVGYCIEHNLELIQLKPEDNRKIQQRLLKKDMFIPYIENNTTDDLAKKAQIYVSSVIEKGCSSDEKIVLDQNIYLVIPYTEDVKQVKIKAEEETDITYTIYKSKLPSKRTFGEKIITYTEKVREGTAWLQLKQVDLKGIWYLTYVFEKNRSISIYKMKNQITGILGGLIKSTTSFYPDIKMNFSSIYSGDNLINGLNRIWGKPNIWISGEEKEPEIRLYWSEIQRIREIILYLNPDLSKELTSSRAKTWSEHHNYETRDGMPPQLIKSFNIYRKTESQYELVEQICNNWKRMVRITLPEFIETSELLIRITETYGAPNAEVFEIRVY